MVDLNISLHLPAMTVLLSMGGERPKCMQFIIIKLILILNSNKKNENLLFDHT